MTVSSKHQRPESANIIIIVITTLLYETIPIFGLRLHFDPSYTPMNFMTVSRLYIVCGQTDNQTPIKLIKTSLLVPTQTLKVKTLWLSQLVTMQHHK